MGAGARRQLLSFKSEELGNAAAVLADVVRAQVDATIKATGWTSTRLRVDLVPWDENRVVPVESEYDTWPEDDRRTRRHRGSAA